jgi:type IV pilus assembly protein PilW
MTPRLRASGPRPRGRTLVELMVSIAIGLSVTAAIAAAFLSTSHMARYADGSSTLADTAQTALLLMGDALRQAGYGEIVGSDLTLGPGDAASMRSQTLFGDGAHLGGCTGGRVDDDTLTTLGCAKPDTPDFDTVFVRFQGDASVAPSQSPIADCLGIAVPQEPLPPGHIGLARTPSRPMVQNVYYGRDGRLWCRGNGRAAVKDPFAAAAPIAGNVEQFKVFYGFDDVRHANPLASPVGTVRSLRDATYLNGLSSATSNPWDHVIAVHVCLVVRTPAPQGADLAAHRTYKRCPRDSQEAGGGLVQETASDGALRRTYTQVFVVRARSPASPKEFLP